MLGSNIICSEQHCLKYFPNWATCQQLWYEDVICDKTTQGAAEISSSCRGLPAFLCHGSASNEPANAQRPLELTEDNFQRGVMDL
jgi:hypothetical protein